VVKLWNLLSYNPCPSWSLIFQNRRNHQVPKRLPQRNFLQSRKADKPRNQGSKQGGWEQGGRSSHNINISIYFLFNLFSPTKQRTSSPRTWGIWHQIPKFNCQDLPRFWHCQWVHPWIFPQDASRKLFAFRWPFLKYHPINQTIRISQPLFGKTLSSKSIKEANLLRNG